MRVYYVDGERKEESRVMSKWPYEVTGQGKRERMPIGEGGHMNTINA